MIRAKALGIKYLLIKIFIYLLILHIDENMFLFIEPGFYNTTKRSIWKRLNGFAADLANLHKEGERIRFVNRVLLTCS